MLFLLLAVAVGVLAGWGLGGSLTRLSATPLHFGWGLAAAVALQLAGALLTSGAAYSACLLASLVLAVGFLAVNHRLAGRIPIALGLAGNAVAIATNSGMPVSRWAAAHAGVAIGPLASDPRHVLAGSSTHLRALTDLIPLALPVSPQVLSVGDILVAAGVAVLIAQGMRRRTHEPVALTSKPRPLPVRTPVSRTYAAPRRAPSAVGPAP